MKLGTKPTIFVAHSLGGLLVKSVLRAAHDTHEPKWKELLNNTREIVFLGTPHRKASAKVPSPAPVLAVPSERQTERVRLLEKFDDVVRRRAVLAVLVD